MALPSFTSVSTAIATLQSVALEDKTLVGAEKLFTDLLNIATRVENLYPASFSNIPRTPDSLYDDYPSIPNSEVIEVTITDGAQANIAALITALGVVDGDVVRVNGTGDSTDNAQVHRTLDPRPRNCPRLGVPSDTANLARQHVDLRAVIPQRLDGLVRHRTGERVHRGGRVDVGRRLGKRLGQ